MKRALRCVWIWVWVVYPDLHRTTLKDNEKWGDDQREQAHRSVCNKSPPLCSGSLLNNDLLRNSRERETIERNRRQRLSDQRNRKRECKAEREERRQIKNSENCTPHTQQKQLKQHRRSDFRARKKRRRKGNQDTVIGTATAPLTPSTNLLSKMNTMAKAETLENGLRRIETMMKENGRRFSEEKRGLKPERYKWARKGRRRSGKKLKKCFSISFLHKSRSEIRCWFVGTVCEDCTMPHHLILMYPCIADAGCVWMITFNMHKY